MRLNKVCGRCGLAEKRGRVFENVSTFQLCINCAQIAYKLKDALSKGDILIANEVLNDFKRGVTEGTDKQAVIVWIESFTRMSAQKYIADLEKVLSDILNKHDTFANGELSKASARLYLDLIGVVEGVHPFEFDSKRLEGMRMKYRYIELASDYWRA